MVDLTPPSSSANTPKREMDVDERRYSSGSDGPGGGPGSDTELDEAEPIETGQATPPLVEGDTAPSAGTGTGAAASDVSDSCASCVHTGAEAGTWGEARWGDGTDTAVAAAGQEQEEPPS